MSFLKEFHFSLFGYSSSSHFLLKMSLNSFHFEGWAKVQYRRQVGLVNNNKRGLVVVGGRVFNVPELFLGDNF